ncbi:MAG: 6-bladed beta-propeller [Candidatus Aminicenantes bacterium]|nr:6-bladed beta-propeller [Candidatus Aminicenantes bacterium]
MFEKIVKWIFSIVFCFSFLIFFLNCTPQEKFSIEKKDGVDIVTNPDHPIPKNGFKKRIVFEEDLTIGSAKGEKNTIFSGFISLNTDDKGYIYISDHNDLEIRKYDPNGKYLFTIGRKGQGPGEFQSVTAVRFDKDHHIFVGDVTARKILFFESEGKYLRQTALPVAIENIYINSKGFFIATKHEQKLQAKAMTIISVQGLLDQEFGIMAELQKIERIIKLPGRDVNARIQIYANMINLMVFKPSDFLTLGWDDLIYVGHPDKYEIKIYSPQGKLSKIITRDYKPVRVGKKDIENFKEEMSHHEMFQNAPEEMREKLVDLIKFPKYKPAYQSFSLIESGMNQSFTLLKNGWLAVIADYRKDEYTVFDLFDEEGRYIAQFQTSIPVEGLFFENGKAYAVATEEGYKCAKRFSIKLQEYIDGTWIDSKITLNILK